MATSDTVPAIIGGCILLAIIGAVVYLGNQHVIDGSSTVAILSSIVSLAGGIFGVHTGVKAGAKAAGLEPKK